MKLIINTMYEQYRVSANTVSFRTKNYEVKPIKIIRSPCGSGAAAKRYHYEAVFIGFGDMLNCLNKSVVGEEVIENISRKLNHKFNPKKLNWNGNVAIITKEKNDTL